MSHHFRLARCVAFGRYAAFGADNFYAGYGCSSGMAFAHILAVAFGNRSTCSIVRRSNWIFCHQTLPVSSWFRSDQGNEWFCRQARIRWVLVLDIWKWIDIIGYIQLFIALKFNANEAFLELKFTLVHRSFRPKPYAHSLGSAQCLSDGTPLGPIVSTH